MISLKTILRLICCCIAICSLAAGAQTTHRTTLSLDGQWDVEDSIGANRDAGGLPSHGASARVGAFR